jgi:hypothetical protein
MIKIPEILPHPEYDFFKMKKLKHAGLAKLALVTQLISANRSRSPLVFGTVLVSPKLGHIIFPESSEDSSLGLQNVNSVRWTPNLKVMRRELEERENNHD